MWVFTRVEAGSSIIAEYGLRESQGLPILHERSVFTNQTLVQSAWRIWASMLIAMTASAIRGISEIIELSDIALNISHRADPGLHITQRLG